MIRGLDLMDCKMAAFPRVHYQLEDYNAMIKYFEFWTKLISNVKTTEKGCFIW